MLNIINRNQKGKALLSLGAAIATGVGLVGITAPGAAASPVVGLTFTAPVIGVGSGSFTVKRANQAVTVDVSPATTYSEQGLTAASFANVLTGERVEINGSITSNIEVVDANHVQVMPMLPNDFDGTVSSLGSGSFIALRGTSPVSVMISPKTTFSVGGVAATSSSLANGDRIIVHGTTNTGGTIVDATQIYILSFGSLHFTATVTSVGSGSFDVRRINEPVTVQVSSKTTYGESGVRSASFADVKTGERVSVSATDTATTNTLKATHVQITPLPAMDINATVTQVGTSSFSVLRGGTHITVEVSPHTLFTSMGKTTPPHMSEVMPGDAVIVHGTSNPGGSVINATHIYFVS
ncbi:MAG TPA: DUF5666 domain-containing protein [Acidimicrobiales bacterium]|nr:DUF5666 domain-containing protein [Acidimicrobiales bacterium]